MTITTLEFIARRQPGGAVKVEIRLHANRTVHHVGRMILAPDEWKIMKSVLDRSPDPTTRVKVIEP